MNRRTLVRGIQLIVGITLATFAFIIVVCGSFWVAVGAVASVLLR